MYKKFKKPSYIPWVQKGLLVLGTTLFFVHPLTATTPIIPTKIESTDIFYNKVLEDLKPSQKLDYIPKNITLTLKPLILTYHERSEDYTSNTKANGNCEIIISLNSEGYVDYVGSMQNRAEFYNITIPQNQKESEIMRKILVLHEASHCEFSNFKEPILIKGMPKLQNNINYLFRYASSSTSRIIGENREQNNNSVYQLLNENFADTYAAIQIIKLYGPTNDVLNMLVRFEVQRHEQSLYFENKQGLESHDSHFALQEVLKPQTIQKIMNTEDAESLKYLALDIANHSIGNVIVNNSFEQAVNKNSLVKGVFEEVNRIRDQNYKIENGELSKITNYHFDANENNSFIFRVALAISLEDNLMLYDKNVNIEGRYNFINYNLASMAGFGSENALNYFINRTTTQYKKYLFNNFKPNNLDYINNKDDDETLHDKFTIIKNDFIENLKVLDIISGVENLAFLEDNNNES